MGKGHEALPSAGYTISTGTGRSTYEETIRARLSFQMTLDPVRLLSEIRVARNSLPKSRSAGHGRSSAAQ